MGIVEGQLVDFSEALKQRINSMSAEELAATEARRLSRQAEQTGVPTLEARFGTIASGNASTIVKDLVVKVDAPVPPGSDDILRFSQEPGFHESIILVPSTYRLIAGAAGERFVVAPGDAKHERVCVDRAALATLVERQRPEPMALARRLIEMEGGADLALKLPEAKRIALFEERWRADAAFLRIDAAVAKVASRAVLLIAGQDHVALWVRQEDMVVGPDRILGSPLAAAIVRPPHYRAKCDDVIAPGGRSGDARQFYLQNTFGSGPERSLIIDVARLRKIAAVMAEDADRDAALVLFEKLVDRSLALGRERDLRGRPSGGSRIAVRA